MPDPTSTPTAATQRPRPPWSGVRAGVAAAVAAGALVTVVASTTSPVQADPASGVGKLTVDDSGHWFEYAGNGEPYFMAGSGGPEGFLYYSDARKQAIVDQLIDNDVRAVYIHAVRSDGGDGGSDENPFVGNDAANGIDPNVLDEWDTYLSQLDDAGIVTWFHLYDDGARPFGACNTVLPADEQQFVRTLVERFRDYQHLVWLPTEEHIIKACSDNSKDVEKAKALAAEIRKHDDVHPVGVHHNNGQSNQYLGNGDIDVFSQQVCQQSRFTSVDGLHTAGEFGEDVYVMAECHPWHKELLDRGDRTTLRQSFWASVMAGGYVLFYDAWESNDPTPGMLADLGRINAFMDTTRFAETQPADQLAAAGTKWVLGNEDVDVYILYSNEAPSSMGVQGVSAGTYAVEWFDAVSGQRVAETVTVGAGTAVFPVPAAIGSEVAVFVERLDGTPSPTTAPPTTAPPTTAPPTTAPPTTAPPTTAPPTTAPPTTAPPTTAPPTGSSVRIGADADAYLQNGTAFDNDLLRLEAGSRTRVSYLRFDTSSLGAAERVQLELVVGSDPGSGTVTVATGIGGSWTEATLSPATAPEQDEIVGSITQTYSSGDTVIVELDPSVVDDDVVDLILRFDESGSNDTAFVSSEGGVGPTLVLTPSTTAPPTTAPPTTTPPTTAPPTTTAPSTTTPPTTTPPTQVTASYAATDDVVPNPERGFHQGVSVADSASGSTTSVGQMQSIHDDGHRLARMYIRLDDHRNAPIPQQLLDELDTVFDRARTAGIKLIPRFSYNFGSAPDAPIERIEQHLDQVTPVLEANSDVIAVLQAGFIGAWGEWHSSSNGLTNPTDRARVRAALFDALPDDRMVQLRYPKDVIELEPTPLTEAGAWTTTDQARLGHKNDCFLANEHDAGTYWPLSRKAEYQSYLDAMTEFVAVGGETCQVSAGSQRTDCSTAIDELDRFDWDYLNIDFFGNTIEQWRNDGCFDEIERRLGYRFRLTEASADGSVSPGSTWHLCLDVTNEGFGKLYNPRPLDAVFVAADGSSFRVELAADARTVLPTGGESATLQLAGTVPAGVAAGSYDVHLALPDGSPSLADDPRYSVRFANAGTWRLATGTNDLGLQIVVGGDPSPGPDPTPDPDPTPSPDPDPVPLVVPTIADAYLQTSGASSFGVDSDLLRVESGSRTRTSHLLFDTGSIPSDRAVTLRLTVGADGGAGTLTVNSAVGGAWSGGVLTAAVASAPGDPIASISGSFDEGDVIEFVLPAGTVADATSELVVTSDAVGADDVSFVASGQPGAPALIVGS